MRADEDRVIQLIEELWELLPEDMVTENAGTFLRQVAIMCLDYEREERVAVVAYLEHANGPRCLIDLIQRGVHRKRSSTVMRALLKAGELERSRTAHVDDVLKKYVKEG